MKKTLAILLSVVMLLGVLAGCTGGSNEDKKDDGVEVSSGSEDVPAATSGKNDEKLSAIELTNEGEELTDLVLYKTSDLESWDIFYCNAATGFYTYANVYDPLLTHDIYGNLAPCLAESWGTDDNGRTWTFNLRQDAVWVDKNGEYKADVTSEDWVTSLEWVLNYWASEGRNASFATDTIEGALDYYKYTQSLSDEEAMASADYDLFKDMVGIETPDEYTVVYHCVDEIVYFDTLATYCVLYPLSGDLLEELGREGYKACTPDDLWYNGPYVVSEFTRDNEHVMTPNPLWWDTESSRFDSVTYKIVDSTDTAFLMFDAGEFDKVELSESNIRAIADNPASEYYDNLVIEHTATFAGKITFNYAKNNEDGTPDENWNNAIANLNFRKALYYGVDWTEYLGRQNSLDPLASQGYTITSPGLCKVDGVDYADYVEGLLGLDSSADTYDRYDEELGQQYKEAAIKELSAAGVTFPIELTYYVLSSNQNSLDTANVFKANLEEYMGDLITVSIKSYVSSYNEEVFIPSLYSVSVSGWAADYGDPIAVLSLMCNDVANLNFSRSAKIYEATTEVVDLFTEYTAMCRAADAVHDDLNKRYKEFADAEVYAIENVMFLPLYTTSFVELTRINDYTHAQAGYGIQEYRLINIQTSSDLYTQEDWEKLKENYEANKK